MIFKEIQAKRKILNPLWKVPLYVPILGKQPSLSKVRFWDSGRGICPTPEPSQPPTTLPHKLNFPLTSADLIVCFSFVRFSGRSAHCPPPPRWPSKVGESLNTHMLLVKSLRRSSILDCCFQSLNQNADGKNMVPLLTSLVAFPEVSALGEDSFRFWFCADGWWGLTLAPIWLYQEHVSWA